MEHAKSQILEVKQESEKTLDVGLSQLFQTVLIDQPKSGEGALFFSKQLQASIMHIAVGDKDEVYWLKVNEGGYNGAETITDSRILYLIRLVYDSIDDKSRSTKRMPSFYHVYKSLHEVVQFHRQSEMRKRIPFGKQNIETIMQDEEFKKGNQYFRAHFMDKASSALSDYFKEIARLIREAQPEDQRLFSSELDDFFFVQHGDRSERIRKESNECSLFGVSASFVENGFLREASKVLLDEIIVCSVETQIRASGLRHDGYLHLNLQPWKQRALTLCQVESVRDTQQIRMSAASIERARKALNHDKLQFLKQLCTQGHELRRRFDTLCEEWESKAKCPMLPSQKAQMAVVCFLTELNAQNQFQAAIKDIEEVSEAFFEGTKRLMQRNMDVGQGCWYTHQVYPYIQKMLNYPTSSSVSTMPAVLRGELDKLFAKLQPLHEEQALNACKMEELIINFNRASEV
jgi:hypothetical protein